MPIAIRRIHSKYLGDKAFPKGITEFEIREFFTLSDVDLRAIRVDSSRKPRPAGWISTQDERMNESRIAPSRCRSCIRGAGRFRRRSDYSQIS